MSEPGLDVRHLPTHAFGPRDLTWWGTIGFILIEGTSLLLCAASVIYLRRNFPTWPPPDTRRPDLLIPTINLVLLLSTIIPMWLVSRYAPKRRVRVVRWSLFAATLMAAAVLVLRGFEFAALNTRYDSSAYGSVVWVTLGFHTFLVFTDFLETVALTILYFIGPLEERHLVDATNNAAYTFFLPLSWLPLYALLFLWPGLG